MKSFIRVKKENGVEEKSDKLIIRSTNLQKLSKLSQQQYEKVIELGIKFGCLAQKKNNSKTIITLVSEEVNEDPESAANFEKLMNLITVLKENGVEDENDKLVIRSTNLQKLSKLSQAQYEKILELGIKFGCFAQKQNNSKTIITLISEEINKDHEIVEHFDQKEKTKLLIHSMREEDEETEEGFLFLTEKSCRKVLNLNSKSISKLVKESNEFKFSHKDSELIVCYKGERRFSVHL